MTLTDMLIGLADEYCAKHQITRAEIGLRIGSCPNFYWRLRKGNIRLASAQALLDLCGRTVCSGIPFEPYKKKKRGKA